MKASVLSALILSLPSLSFARDFKKTCTLIPVEQDTFVKSIYTADQGEVLSFDVHVPANSGYAIILGLKPIYRMVNGTRQVVTYHFQQNPEAGSEVIRMSFDSTGVVMSTNFYKNFVPWPVENEKTLLQSVMYKLPDERLALAVLVCKDQ